MNPCVFCKEFKEKVLTWLMIVIPLAVVPVLAGWVGDVLKDWCTDIEVKPAAWQLFWLGVVALPLLAGVIVWKGRQLLPSRVIEQTRNHPQRKVVIAMLSPCKNLVHKETGWEVEGRDNAPKSMDKLPLDQLVGTQSGLPQWTWQQTLRTAYYHRVRLEKLVLIGSRGGSGTEDQLGLAAKFFGAYFPGKVYLPSQPQPESGKHDQRWTADFEDLGALLNLLRDVVRDILADNTGYRESDIVIDCTGGFKVASIAAAMVTLDRPDILFQYVNNEGQVIAFNAISEYHKS